MSNIPGPLRRKKKHIRQIKIFRHGVSMDIGKYGGERQKNYSAYLLIALILFILTVFIYYITKS